MSEIQIIENVLKANDEVAGINRQHFREAGVFTLDLIGSPGCGKTTLLEQTLRRLDGELTCGVVVGDLATTRDAERLKRWSPHVVQINTGRGCHLEAHQVRQAIDHLDLAALDLLVIENVGNLICPVGFDLGQDHKIAMFSITEGDDKAAKHPHVVVAAELILLNKMDLLGRSALILSYSGVMSPACTPTCRSCRFRQRKPVTAWMVGWIGSGKALSNTQPLSRLEIDHMQSVIQP
jgi:hydrogenase nickel incorporation protein HypB